MARRKHSFFDDGIALTSKLPWWVGVVFALATYVWLHSVATQEVTAVAQQGKMGEFSGQTLLNTFATFGQYVLPAIFLLGATMSAYGRFRRGASHPQGAASPGLGALSDLSWRQFELLVGKAFRRRGYSVAETGSGGAEGGFDLVLKKEGKTYLVQCKQWRAIKLGVNTVRELHGVMAAHGATGGFVVTSGVFTEEAQAFAAGQNITLMDGKALHVLISGVSVPGRGMRNPLSMLTTGAPFCPVCQSRMVMRKATRGTHVGKQYWGCSRYPDCRGKRRL